MGYTCMYCYYCYNYFNIIGVSVNIGTEFVLSTPSMPLVGDINCFGNEERLQDCYIANWNMDTCTSGTEYAGVTCECT